MFEKITKCVTDYLEGTEPVDTSQFNDPVAELAEWSSLHAGAKSFRTHELKQVGAERAEFCLSWGGWVYYGSALFFGLPLLVAGPLKAYALYGFHPKVLITVAAGLALSWFGVWLLRLGTTPIVFDRKRGRYWRGRIAPGTVAASEVLLADVHALQLLREHVRGDRSAYFCYELNLVCHDGRRLAVIQHGGRDAIHADAVKLAAFLGVPLWAPNSSVLP